MDSNREETSCEKKLPKIDIINCDREFFEKQEINSSYLLKISNFVINNVNALRFCEICKRVHEINNENSKNSATAFNNTKFNFKSVASNNFDNFGSTSSLINGFDQLDLDKQCKEIKSSILYKIGSLKSQLNEEKDRSLKSLNEIKCRFYNDLKEECFTLDEFLSYVQVTKNKLNNKHYKIDLLELNKLIDELNIKKDEFNSCFMSKIKNLRFVSNLNENLNERSIGFLLCTKIFKEHSNENEYHHLKFILDNFKSNQKIPLINKIDFKSELSKIYDCQLLSLLTIEENILLCNRYAKSMQKNDIYCELNLYDCDSMLLKHLVINNRLVRCLHSNSQYLILTLESDENWYFEFNLYDSKLNLIKSIKIDNYAKSNHPVLCYIDDLNRCFLLKNRMPFFNVYDINLNLLTQFGQNITPTYGYYLDMPIEKINNICVKNDIVYVHSNENFLISRFDLKTGKCVKITKLNYFVNNFFVNPFELNEIIFINTNKLIRFNLEESLVSKENEINLTSLKRNQCAYNSMPVVTSYYMNKDGFFTVLFHNQFQIATF